MCVSQSVAPLAKYLFELELTPAYNPPEPEASGLVESGLAELVHKLERRVRKLERRLKRLREE